LFLHTPDDDLRIQTIHCPNLEDANMDKRKEYVEYYLSMGAAMEESYKDKVVAEFASFGCDLSAYSDEFTLNP
jgi:hypothetical protein